jgi:hypothetical protein
MTSRDVIACLDEFEDAETIFVESATPTALAVVTAEPADGSPPGGAAGLRYLLEIRLAREAIEVWRAWHAGQDGIAQGQVRGGRVRRRARRLAPGLMKALCER